MRLDAGTSDPASPSSSRWLLALALAAAILFWGFCLEAFLLYLCEVDDTGNPHSCPYSITALVVLAIASVATAFLCARVALRSSPMRIAGGSVVSAIALVAFALALAEATE
jgi:hypothetical protein